MANGRLGASDLLATTNTSVYTVPASTYSVFNVNVCNRSAVTATVRLALAAAGTPVDAEYIEYDTEISANGVLERTGLMLDAAKILVAYSDVVDVSVVAYGIETTV